MKAPRGFRKALEDDAACWRSMREGIASGGLTASGWKRTWHKAKRRAESCEEDDTPERYHKLRRWVKYLFYQRLHMEAAGAPRKRRLRDGLQRLGHLLGRRHDLHQLHVRLEPVRDQWDKAGWEQMAYAEEKLRGECAILRRKLFS